MRCCNCCHRRWFRKISWQGCICRRTYLAASAGESSILKTQMTRTLKGSALISRRKWGFFSDYETDFSLATKMILPTFLWRLRFVAFPPTRLLESFPFLHTSSLSFKREMISQFRTEEGLVFLESLYHTCRQKFVLPFGTQGLPRYESLLWMGYNVCECGRWEGKKKLPYFSSPHIYGYKP